MDYAGSPYMHKGCPRVSKECCCNWASNPESVSIALSCRLPSTGPYKLAIRPFGATTDWNLMQ